MSESRFGKRKFAAVHRRKRPKAFMRKAPEVPTASEILPSPSPVLTASGKKLALAASRSSANSESNSSFSLSSGQHDNQEDYHLVKMSSLQRGWHFFMLWLSSDSDRGQTMQEGVSVQDCHLLYGVWKAVLSD